MAHIRCLQLVPGSAPLSWSRDDSNIIYAYFEAGRETSTYPRLYPDVKLGETHLNLTTIRRQLLGASHPNMFPNDFCLVAHRGLILGLFLMSLIGA